MYIKTCTLFEVGSKTRTYSKRRFYKAQQGLKAAVLELQMFVVVSYSAFLVYRPYYTVVVHAPVRQQLTRQFFLST